MRLNINISFRFISPTTLQAICCLVGLFLLSSSQIQAQDEARIDSLKGALQKSDEVNGKVLIYAQLGEVLRASDTTQAIQYFNQGLELAEELEFTMGIAQIQEGRAQLYTVLNKPYQANKYYREAIEAYKLVGENQKIVICGLF